MGLFKKKSTVDKNSDDMDLVKSNAGQLEVVGVYLREMSDEVNTLFGEVKHKADFSSASPKADIAKIDKKISQTIGDLNLKLATGKADEDKVKTVLRELLVYYTEREAQYFTKE